MKKLNILFSSFPDFSGNSKALYEYMKKKYNNSIKLMWVVYKESNLKLLKSLGIDCVLYKDNDKFNITIDKANIIFDTHGSLINDKKEGQYYINLWHGIGPKNSGYLLGDENLSSNDINFLDQMRRKTDYIIVTSELWRSGFSSIFNFDARRVISLGMARCDYLFESNGKKNLEHITNKKLDNYKKIIFYLPTFRKGCGRDNDGYLSTKNVLNLNEYKEEELLDFLDKNKYLLVMKLHPSEETEIKKIDHPNVFYLNDAQLENNRLIIYEILNCADLLITDYSSIYTEYLLLKKPVLFLNTDIEEYGNKRGLKFDSTDFWFPGPMVNNINNLKNETDLLLKNQNYYKVEREKFLNIMFDDTNGNFCEKVCNYFIEDGKISKRCTLYQNKEIMLEKELKEKELKYKVLEEITNEEKKELKEKISFLEEENSKQKVQYKMLDDEFNLKTILYNELNTELTNIKNSRSWKFVQVIRKIKEKVFFFIK